MQTSGPAGHNLIARVLPIISGLGVALARSSASWCFHVAVGSSTPKHDGSAHKEPHIKLAGDHVPTQVTVLVLFIICVVKHLWLPATKWHSLNALDILLMERRKVWKIKNLHIFHRGVEEVIAFIKLEDMIKKNKQTNQKHFQVHDVSP